MRSPFYVLARPVPPRLPGAAQRGPDPDPPRRQGRAPPASLGCPPPACPSGSGPACGAPERRRGWRNRQGPSRHARSSPRAVGRRGHGPRSDHRGRGTPREPRCRPVNARDPIPAAPAASAGHGPRPVPSFSSRRLCDVPVLRRPAKRSQARRTRLRNPLSLSVAFQPFARLVVGGSAGCVGSAQRRVGAGAFPPPPGQGPPGLTPATETRPVPGTPPGAMAAESHRRGRRPTPGPARSATARDP